MMSSSACVRELIQQADVVIGGGASARSEGAKTGKPGDAQTMKKGAVLVDVAIDQGGCFENIAAHYASGAQPTKLTASCIIAWPICPEPYR